MAASKYTWQCPGCGTKLELRKRVALRKRTCPQCGHLVETQEIDRQATVHGIGSLIVFAVLLCLGIFVSSQQKSKDLSREPSSKVEIGENNSKFVAPSDSSNSNSNSPNERYSLGSSSNLDVDSSEHVLNTENVINAGTTTGDNSDSSRTRNEKAPGESEELSHGKLPSASSGLDSGTSNLIGDNHGEWVEPLLAKVETGKEGVIAADIEALALKSPPTNSSVDSDNINKEGLRALKLADYEKASAYFLDATNVCPNDPKLWSNLGFAQFKSGNFVAAKDSLYKSLWLAPNRPVAWGDLGMNFAKSGETTKAATCLFIGLKISNGKTKSFVKSLLNDEETATRDAAAQALKRYTIQ